MRQQSFIKPLKMQQTDKGQLQIQVRTGIRNRPIQGAKVRISYTGAPGEPLEELETDRNGRTDVIDLPTPPLELSLTPQEMQPYSEYNINIQAPGFEPVEISGVEMLSGEMSLQDAFLREQARGAYEDIVIPAHTLYGDYPPKIPEDEIKPMDESGEIVLSRVVVPEYVVVHDGAPSDSTAQNYYVRYRDYIKNVASSEIYATWPLETIKANVLAIMSFTLNRVYTEW